MSKLTEQLRTKGVFNVCGFYGNQPYFYYRPRTVGRAGESPRWVVRKADEKLSGAWYDYGAKTFILWGDKKKAMADAQAFVTERYGVKDFARDPFGGYGDAAFIKARIKEILALPAKENK